MAAPRLSTALRRVARFVQDFGQCRAAYDAALDVHQCRAFSARKKSIVDEIDNDGATAKKYRPKTVPIPKITLLSPDDSIMVTDMETAQRLAKRRNLNLVKVSDIDGKTHRSTYKLVSDYLLDDAEKIKVTDNSEERYKEIKLLYISAKITKHDLSIKMKNIVKLLKKGHKVKIVINLDDTKEDETQSIIEKAVKDHGTTQKMSSKKTVVLLVITPLLNKDDDNPVNIKETTVSTTSNQGDNT